MSPSFQAISSYVAEFFNTVRSARCTTKYKFCAKETPGGGTTCISADMVNSANLEGGEEPRVVTYYNLTEWVKIEISAKKIVMRQPSMASSLDI